MRAPLISLIVMLVSVSFIVNSVVHNACVSIAITILLLMLYISTGTPRKRS